MFDIKSLPYTIIAVALSLTVHEFAHALVSYMLGDPTAKNEGRLSLNPFKHIDWIGVACLALCGFGWGKPVPIDSYYYKDRKFGIVWTSFAGPLSNFLLSIVAILIYVLLFRFSPMFLFSGFGIVLSKILMTIAYTSAGLGVFNLIPVPPLDGSKVLLSFLPDDQYYKFIQGNQYLYYAFIILLVTGVVSAPLAFVRNGFIEGVTNFLFNLILK